MRKLAVGDRVRIISIPKGVFEMPVDMRDGAEGTLTAFQHVLKSGESFIVTKLDKDIGWPWIDFKTVDKSGKEAFHSLLLEPGCYEAV